MYGDDRRQDLINRERRTPVVDPRSLLSESDLIHEAAEEQRFLDQTMRRDGMSIALTWVEEGDYSYGALDNLVDATVDGDVLEDADADDDGMDNELYDDLFNSVLEAAGNALVKLSADEDVVSDFINDENDNLGRKIGVDLSDLLDDEVMEDANIIMKHAIRPDGVIKPEGEYGSEIYESYTKVVRDGKVVLKKKKKKKRKRRTAKQKAAMKKAQRKANTSAAKHARKKAMKIRKQRGMS